MDERTWKCRSGECVAVGDVVALCHGSSTDLVVRIMAGTAHELECEVLRGGGLPRGQVMTVASDQLLLKVFGGHGMGCAPMSGGQAMQNSFPSVSLR